MSNSICSSNITSGFIDLATFDELEKYMYGCPEATAYFVRETRKATWFTQVPVVLSRAAGVPAFDTEWSVSISRAGDYLLGTWLRLTTPRIVASFKDDPDTQLRIRWTRNLMHNIIREACVTFNDLVAARFDNIHLDFWSAFTVPAGKRTGYNNMIGNFPELTHPSKEIAPFTLNLPLPFFFSRDSGVALPTAALPYNDMRISFSFRDWTDLLIVDDLALLANTDGKSVSRCATCADVATSCQPTLSGVQVWANYAIVSNDERKRMACARRDILIEQVQTCPHQCFDPARNARPTYDIRFSHAIKVLFFGARNNTVKSQWSNYTAGSPLPLEGVDGMNFATASMVDPIKSTSIIYENTNRMSDMGSDYYSLVNPWYHAPVIPLETGYHMYSYSLDFMCLDPMGSTNFGKLTNVSVVPCASETAVETGAPVVDGAARLEGAEATQTWEFVVTTVNNNIICVSGGALGFPVL